MTDCHLFAARVALLKLQLSATGFYHAFPKSNSSQYFPVLEEGWQPCVSMYTHSSRGQFDPIKARHSK